MVNTRQVYRVVYNYIPRAHLSLINLLLFKNASCFGKDNFRKETASLTIASTIAVLFVTMIFQSLAFCYVVRTDAHPESLTDAPQPRAQN